MAHILNTLLHNTLHPLLKCKGSPNGFHLWGIYCILGILYLLVPFLTRVPQSFLQQRNYIFKWSSDLSSTVAEWYSLQKKKKD